MASDGSQGPVLLCWDGSESAGSAIAHAARILGAGRRAVVLFTYVPTEEHRGVLAGTSGPDAPVIGLADAEDTLEAGVRVAGEAGFDASGQSITADRKTAEIIVAQAKEHDGVSAGHGLGGQGAGRLANARRPSRPSLEATGLDRTLRRH